MVNFEMKIADVFHLNSGQTIFAGSVTGIEKLINNTKAQLIIDNREQQIIEIQGEMLMDRRHPLNHRAISTTDIIDITSDLVKKHECRLVEI